jgi:RimJ/RimL family protein N-acetyltransferase
MTTLRTERLTLTGIQLEDDGFVLELLNDPGWIANIGDRGVGTVEAARDYIRTRFWKSAWFVARDARGDRVGICGLVDRDGLEHTDLGYAILERYSGKGYATEAAAAVLRHAREMLGHKTILAITVPENKPSQRVLEKIGFRFVREVNLSVCDGPSSLYST